MALLFTEVLLRGPLLVVFESIDMIGQSRSLEICFR